MKCIKCRDKRAFYGTEYSNPIHCKKCKDINESNVTIKKCRVCDIKIKAFQITCSSCLKIKMHKDDSSEDSVKESITDTQNNKDNILYTDRENNESENNESDSQNTITEYESDVYSSNDDMNESEQEEWKLTEQRLRNILINDDASVKQQERDQHLIEEYVETITDLKTKIKITENHLSEIVNQNKKIQDDYQTKVSNLENTIVELNTKHSEDIDNRDKKHDHEIQQSKKELEDINVEYTSELKESKNQINELSKDKEQYEKKVTELNQNILNHEKYIDELEFNKTILTSKLNNMNKQINIYKEQLMEEKEFIYLEWIISCSSSGCSLVRINTSVDTRFTKALIEVLKKEYFKKCKSYSVIIAFLKQYKFEAIKSSTIPIKRNKSCDCINKGSPLRYEIYRTILL